jgi:hypothetical protein
MSMSSAYQAIVFQSRHSVWLSCLVILLINAALFLPTDIWTVDLSGSGIESRAQLIGMLLLIILMPMWLFACLIVSQRHALSLAAQLDTHLHPEHRISEEVSRFPGRQIAIGLIGGLVWALAFNIPSEQFVQVLNGEGASIAITVGQVLIWVCVGLLLFIRLHCVTLFARAGNVIELSIFEPSGLEPFARVGMFNLVAVMGTLGIATVQSIDAQFRLGNYLTAFIIALPAGAALLIMPMWSLHKRMAKRKGELLAEVTAEITSTPETTTAAAIEKLEALLQRRDRVRALRSWPLDIGFWSRLGFYVLIPPLAWVAAAIVEVGVERMLTP